MSSDSGAVPLNPKISIGVDSVGDPFVLVDIVTPPGTMLSADMADQLALKLLAATATARVRAGIVRDQLLAGVDPKSAVEFVNGLMGEPAE